MKKKTRDLKKHYRYVERVYREFKLESLGTVLY